MKETDVKQQAAVTESAQPPRGDESWARRVIHGHYYPHIDGLRSLAVLPVVFYHLQSSICPGGFMGVDVFFAISGYLICGGIIRDLRSGSFSMVSFYHRRIRRIFPAYLVLVLGVLALGVTLYHWARIVPLARTALFGTFFSSNIYFWLDMGYFQPDAHGNPLLHLWSLGVEEQFYIIIPIALLALWKTRISLVFTLLLCFVASLTLCLVVSESGASTTAFYMLPTRGWELLAGALLVALPRARESRGSNFLAILGIVLLTFSYTCVSTRGTFGESGTYVELVIPFYRTLCVTPFPGWVTLPAIAGSLLLLHCGSVQWLLHSRPLVGIGKISYSLYLWHWPIIVFANYVTYERHQSFLYSCAVLAVSLLAAYASWRWVEMPFRISRKFTPYRAFGLVLTGCATLIGIASVLMSTDGLRNILHRRANLYASPPRSFLQNFGKFVSRPDFNPPAYPALDDNYFRLLGQKGQPPSFCLIGDSHASALSPGLDSVATEQHRSGLFLDLRLNPFIQDGSKSTVQRLFDWVAENPDVRDIYLVCRWNTKFQILEGIPRLGDKGRIKPVSPSGATLAEIENSFRKVAGRFAQHDKRVFVFTSVPEYGYDPADIAARREMFALNLPIEITSQDYIDRQAAILSILESLDEEGVLTLVPLHSAFFVGKNSVVMSPTGNPYYMDSHHLTPEGAKYAVQVIAPLLWRSTDVDSSGQAKPISD